MGTVGCMAEKPCSSHQVQKPFHFASYTDLEDFLIGLKILLVISGENPFFSKETSAKRHEGLDSLDFDETPRDEVALRDFLLEEERLVFLLTVPIDLEATLWFPREGPQEASCSSES